MAAVVRAQRGGEVHLDASLRHHQTDLRVAPETVEGEADSHFLHDLQECQGQPQLLGTHDGQSPPQDHRHSAEGQHQG